MSDIDKVLDILDGTQQYNFVQRIIDPKEKLANPDGSFSTHSMAANSDENGNAFVYPTVIQKKDGTLKRLSDEAAWRYAEKTGERIPFGKDLDQAIWFSTAYKRFWDD